MKKVNEIKKLTKSELQGRAVELRTELVDLTIRKESGKLTNTSQIKKKRKILARLLTELREGEQNAK